MWFRISLLLLLLSGCSILDRHTLESGFYEKKCLYHMYSEGEERGCNYRLVPADGATPAEAKPSATK